MTNFVITGGCGFIGSNIAEYLIKKGNSVKIIDDLSTGDINNISEFKKDAKFISASILNLDLLKNELKDADFVIHQAAMPYIQKSVDDPIISNKINVDGTLNVLIASRDCCVKRVIFASSSSVYGVPKEAPLREDMEPKPKSPYALTKLIGEQYLRLFYELYGLETVSLRYFNVFGPKQNPNSQYSGVISLFINKILADESPIIYGDGFQSRDFIFVEDVVQANILACTSKKAAGSSFNIGCGKRWNLHELINIINELTGKDAKPSYGPERKGDVKDSLADISKARKMLSFEPSTHFKAGLKKTIEWYKKG